MFKNIILIILFSFSVSYSMTEAEIATYKAEGNARIITSIGTTDSMIKQEESLNLLLTRWLQPTEFGFAYLENGIVKDYVVYNNLETLKYLITTNLNFKEIYLLQSLKANCRMQWDNDWKLYCQELRISEMYSKINF